MWINLRKNTVFNKNAMNGAIELRFLLLQNLLYGSDIIDIKEQYEKNHFITAVRLLLKA